MALSKYFGCLDWARLLVGDGYPAYDPEMMMKILMYVYSQKIYITRRIAQELMLPLCI